MFGCFCEHLSRYVVQFGTRRSDFMAIHEFLKNITMFLRHFRIGVLHHQVSCLAPVVLHVEQLFAVSSFVVQYIFVACGAYHPAPCLAAVELCFGNDILLVGSLRIAFFGYFAERLSVSVFRQFGACPVANGSEEVYTITDKLRQLRAGMFLAEIGRASCRESV